MAIVYRHRRNDTNEIFYIGIGKTIKRAFSKRNRNIYWNRIVNKYSYSIEIIANELTYEDACELEVFLISEYGRKDLGTGLLVNMTDGGEGIKGFKHSEEFKEKMKTSNNGFETRFKKGSTIGAEYRFKKGQKSINAGTAKKNNCKTCNIIYDINKGGKIYCSKKCQSNCNDYRKKQSELKKGLNIGREFPQLRKPILQFDKENNFIKEFSGVKQAMKETGIHHITAVCKDKRKTAGGFIWKYKNN